MAYAAITSLMRTTHDYRMVGCDYLLLFYENLESSRAVLEKCWKITGNLEALTSLEAEIIDLACKIEDMLDPESEKAYFTKTSLKRIVASWKLRFHLKRALSRMDSTMGKWIAMQKRYTNIKDMKARNLTLANTSQHALKPENMMVGNENEFEMLQDQLARGASELEVVSIVGMGGIGKTTLANKIYNDPLIMSRFDIHAKATVSQDNCARNVLLRLLSTISGKTDEFHEQQDDWKLADQLQKLLKGKRYLIVIDDIWTTGAWDDIKPCFPDCNCGSRILLTTRNMEVAEYASSGKPPYQMRLLNYDESWNLLRIKVFENACFSPEFEKIGKQIALNCKGLPLAIVMIAGVLLKIGESLDEWTSVAENITSLVAEGFLKVERMKSREEVAEQCIKELIDRSLIFIHHMSFDGKIKACGMHDVIRELCLREARNINFVNVIMEDQNSCEQTSHFSRKRRISIQSEQSSFVANQLAMVRYNKAHSILLFIRNPSNSRIMQELVRFKVLRILELALPMLDAFPSCIVDLSQLRYLALTFYSSNNDQDINVPPSIARLHYLHTFILKFPKYYGRPKISFTLPREIFELSQLRHLSSDRNNMVPRKPVEYLRTLQNLQCLSGWNPLCGADLLRVPHVRKLQICANQQDYIKSNEMKGFRDLCNFVQLEELKFDWMPPSVLPPPEAFPKNLKKLAFSNTRVNLEDLRILGKLPKLEALKLKFVPSNIGTEWEVAEEGFPQLKFLLLKRLNIRY